MPDRSKPVPGKLSASLSKMLAHASATEYRFLRVVAATGLSFALVYPLYYGVFSTLNHVNINTDKMIAVAIFSNIQTSLMHVKTGVVNSFKLIYRPLRDRPLSLKSKYCFSGDL